MQLKFNDRFKQVGAQLALASELISGENYIVLSPTGSGKTEVGMIVSAYKLNENPDKRTMILASDQRLVNQWYERFEKYGLTDKMSVRVNPTKAGVTGPWETGGVYQKDKFGYLKRRDFASRWERRIMKAKRGFDTERFEDMKREAYDADVMISTHQLIQSDIKRERVGSSDFKKFQTLIADEAPLSLAYDESAIEGEFDENDIKYRFSRYYEDIVTRLPSSTQFIGLTAFPGKKAFALKKFFSAEIIKPEESLIENYLPDFQTSRIEVRDEFVESMHQNLVAKMFERKINLRKLLKIIDKDYEISELSIPLVSRYATYESKKHERELVESIRATAGSILGLYHNSLGILESTYYMFGNHDSMEYFKKNTGFSEESITAELNERAREQRNLGKIDEILDILEMMPGKTVIATNYVAPTKELHHLLGKKGFRSEYLIGGQQQTREEQSKIIERFNEGNADVLITDYGAGGFGIDLFGGQNIIYAGMPSSLERFIQMRGRITRSKNIGEKKDIFEYIITYEGTSDAEKGKELDNVEYKDWPGRAVGITEDVYEFTDLFSDETEFL